MTNNIRENYLTSLVSSQTSQKLIEDAVVLFIRTWANKSALCGMGAMVTTNIIS